MGEPLVAIELPPAPTLHLGFARLITLSRAHWDAEAELRAALVEPPRPYRERLHWVIARTTVWTMVHAESARYEHLDRVRRRWKKKGVALFDRDAGAPRCVRCGCTEDVACASESGATRKWFSVLPRLCAACLTVRDPDSPLVALARCGLDTFLGGAP